MQIFLQLLSSLAAVWTLAHGYSLSREYSKEDFIDEFDFWDDSVLTDPTGNTNTPSAALYRPQEAAQSEGLVWVNPQGHFGLSVDSANSYSGGARRPSVRISSKDPIQFGLLILDAVHVPYGKGTWPAFWLSGADGDWPNSGEIDILEGVGNSVQNTVSYHTGPNRCFYTPSTLQSGQLDISAGVDCDALAHGDEACGNTDPDTTSFGSGANDAGGGVWAMEWTSDFIKIWHFQRSQIPNDITAGKPVPGKWGVPVTNLVSDNCDINSSFGPQSIIFNIELCGTWEGAVFDGGPQECLSFVQKNPSAFKSAYFEINNLRYYQ